MELSPSFLITLYIRKYSGFPANFRKVRNFKKCHLQWTNELMNLVEIFFQITANKMHNFLIYLFVQTLYMFQAVPPPIIRST
jgi:hypothetical protein